MGSVRHTPKAGVTLTGSEYEASDHHIIALDESDIPAGIARDSEVTAAINAVIDAAPGALDTLNELAAALGDDAAFSTTVTNALAGKQPLDSDLTAIAALTTTAFGRGLLELANAAALLAAAGGAAASHAHAGEDITSGTVADGRVASTLARDSEVTSAVTTHEGAADPHTGYLKESDFTGVDFLVGTATGITAAEIVVGTTPGGELGGTWASPTVDATHSGSSHAGVIATHEAAGDPHPGYLTAAEGNAAYEASGSVATHAAAGDPHTGYRLESADHTHATTGLQGGTVAHSVLTGIGADDHHARQHSVTAAADHTFPGGTTTFLRADGSFATPTASVAFTDFTKDLGVADRAGSFDITGLSGLTADKPVMVMQTAAAISSKGNARDEPEMDQIQVTGYVVDTTTIRCYWQAPAVVVGTYAFAYLVGA